jgi:hypothetical protein
MKEVVILQLLINSFFISFIINIFIVIYSIYSEIDFIFLHNLQGSRLKIKKKEM